MSIETRSIKHHRLYCNICDKAFTEVWCPAEKFDGLLKSARQCGWTIEIIAKPEWPLPQVVARCKEHAQPGGKARNES